MRLIPCSNFPAYEIPSLSKDWSPTTWQLWYLLLPWGPQSDSASQGCISGIQSLLINEDDEMQTPEATTFYHVDGKSKKANLH